MKKTSISFWSWIRLTVHRALAMGGKPQFVFYGLIVLFVLAVTTILFYVTCTYTWQISDYQTDNPFFAAFYHLFTNGGENKLGNMSYAGILVTVTGVVLVSILTSLFTNSFDKVAQRYLSGDTHYKVKRHVVVMGYHEMLPGLLQQLFASGEKGYFLIQTTHVERARNELSRVLTSGQMKRVILQNGEISSKVDLPMMRVHRAGEVFILGEEKTIGDDASHDTTVLQCLTNIVDSLPVPGDGKKIVCHVMFEYQSTFAVFQHTDLSNSVLEKMAFLPFNYYEMWARKVFVNDSLSPSASEENPYLPLEGKEGIDKDSQDHVHLVVIGMSRMGIAMGIQAAHLAHYPNFLYHPECKTRITFIDKDAHTLMYNLQGRMDAMFQVARWRYVEPSKEAYSYAEADIDAAPWHNPLTDSDSRSPYKSGSSHLGKDFVDLEWEFIQADDANPAVQQYIRRAASQEHTRLTVAVCVTDPNRAVAIGVNLPREVYESAVQVLFYQGTGDALVKKLSTGAVAEYAPYEKARPFGMSAESYDFDLTKKLVFIATNIDKEGVSVMKDTTLEQMLVQDAALQLQKTSSSKSAAANMWSNIYHGAHMWTKLRSVHSQDGALTDEEVELLAQTEHVRWVAEQLLTQYRPLTESEQKGVLAGELSKDVLKREKFAHLDIASRPRLLDIDPGTVPYDANMVRFIPGLFRRLQNRK